MSLFRDSGFVLSSARIDDALKTRAEMAAKSIPFHVSCLDDVAIGILPTDLIVIGADTGAGKTTLGMLMAQTAARHGIRVGYFALEAFQGEIELRMLYRIIGKLAWRRLVPNRHELSYGHWLHGKCDHVVRHVLDDALAELREDVGKLATFYRTAKFTAQDLVRGMAAVKSQTDLLIVDHLHFIDNDSQDENRGMKQIVKAMSDAILETQTPVVAIAHLRKKDSNTRKQPLVPSLSEFHGASDITKIATKAIVLAPAKDRQSSQPHIKNTYVRLPKDRIVGETGLTALMQFDLRTNTYHDAYELGRLTPDGTDWKRLSPEERPWWASQAICAGSANPAAAQEALL